MKNLTRILVIDHNKTMISKIENHFSSHAKLSVVKTITDGKTALNYIIENQNDFDVIIMDLIFPEFDGINILKTLKLNNINKKIIVISGYKCENVLRNIEEYNISFYMLKPFSMLALETRILELTCNDYIISEFNDTDKQIHINISNLLHKLGIPTNIRGYAYIRDSIFLFYKNFDKYSGVTKEIYPQIADKYQTTITRVERAIRHAIEVSWTRSDYNLMFEIFGNSIDGDRAKPSNFEYIATLADKIRIDNLCKTPKL